MDLADFEERFGEFWDERLTTFDPATHGWWERREDDRQRAQCQQMLLDYAASVRRVGISRRTKNKAQRLFDEMGVDPATLELDPFTSPGEVPSSHPGGRIMYIEQKSTGLKGQARIGRVATSKSGRTLWYGGLTFRTLGGEGHKANYYCVETGDEYWISAPKRDGGDRLYGERLPIHIDPDAREEYWTEIRKRPAWKDRAEA